MLLEVLLGGGDELDGNELEAAVLEARDDGADQAALGTRSAGLLPALRRSFASMVLTWTPSGLIAMKLPRC